MSHIICYSGGHSSGLVAIEVARKHGAENVILLNHDIILRSERQDIKRFKQEVADYLGVPITYANMAGWDQKDQFDVVIEAGAFKVGNGTALCTNRMKTQPFEAWLKQNAHTGDVIYYGFDPKERNRIQRRSSHIAHLGFRADFPLALWDERTITSTEEIGIQPPSVYDTFRHANCTGCLKAGAQHWYIVYCEYPETWKRAKEAEEIIGYTIIKQGSLEEFEPKFAAMRDAGIEPTERIPAPTFWASVRKRLKSIQVEETQADLPCDCAA